MSNAFSKEEQVAFEQVLSGFEDGLVMSKNVTVYQTDSLTMERSNDIIWRPMPQILPAFAGVDMTSNVKDVTQLSVPATLGFKYAIPLQLTETELRDMTQSSQLETAAGKKLASVINTSVMDVAKLQGTMVIKRTSAAAGFDDVAQVDQILLEQGVTDTERYLALSARDYNGMAKDLANRQTLQGKPVNAYEKAYVGEVASFSTYKLDVTSRLTAAAGGAGLTVDSRSSASNYFVPAATFTSGGAVNNRDNRYQQITISSTTNVAAGDAFTIAGITSVHHLTKGDTGNLKTFRVISVDSATAMTISPPIISAQGGAPAEVQYQNCIVSGSGSATAAIVFLNTVTAPVNCFWAKDSIELLPGAFAAPNGAGSQVLRATLENGIGVQMAKQHNPLTAKITYVWRVFFGVCMTNPEKAGIMLFSQT